MLVSIITINYNNLNGLRSTYQSVANQKSVKFEYIVIDGGSTDGSKEFLLQNKHCIDYSVSEKDFGIYHAMNKGLKVSTGDYLLYLNSGDCLLDVFSLHNIFLQLGDDSNFDLIIGGIQSVNYKKNVFPYSSLRDYITSGKIVPHQGTLIKRKLLKSINGFSTLFQVAGDHHFFSRISKYNNLKVHLSSTILVEMSPGGRGTILSFRHLLERLYIELLYNRNKKTLFRLVKQYLEVF